MAIQKNKKISVGAKLRKKLISTRTIEKNKTWNKATTIKKEVKKEILKKEQSKIKPMVTHKPKEASNIVKASMDCLYAKCIPCITDCVIAELEKLGTKFKVALRAAKDPRFVRLKCTHKGCYADDCIVNRVSANPVYVVGTCDKDLKRRLRKIPGVPLMYIRNRQYTVERLPDVDKLSGGL
ncbi:hypothetical protein FDP41_002023 [Naegleria fowleri]|uniref:PIN domain-containing protein n=1 Tax=Naegleria fowleri TaxID=5763 RepID=A0A6A5BLQ8_NAEFO|nr:uncharacterized protein FDP41_002023 [Naegleria fowleri]KAF0978953.1 hypothetical protein FDP41_002023 [Naegleria fowleri]